MTRVSDSLLEVSGLSKKFGQATAVNNLCFSLKKGSIVGMLGGNGAGKTTTLSMLLGLLEPTTGDIRLFGHDFIKDRHAVLHRINFCSPYVDLPQRLTVRENLRVFARLYGVNQVGQVIQQLSEDFRLLDLMDQPIRRLSSGQKTRVSLAKALINKPEFLLLDEPTASLSPDVSQWIRQRLTEYRDQTGATILFASHDMREVELLCDYIVMMSNGRLIEEGSPQDLKTRHRKDSLEEVFLELSDRGAVA
jgi:ABC-2 type transport system ATP-binding protein